MNMNDEIARVFAAMRELPDFAEIDVSDINACGTDGDNALHFAVGNSDFSAARALIEAGINIDKAGDLGYTPLHVACIAGNFDMVKLLVEKGADLFALSEGDTPFMTALRGEQGRICEFLKPLMKQAGSRDPESWLRARIAQLRRETANLEARLQTRLREKGKPEKGETGTERDPIQ